MSGRICFMFVFIVINSVMVYSDENNDALSFRRGPLNIRTIGVILDNNKLKEVTLQQRLGISSNVNPYCRSKNCAARTLTEPKKPSLNAAVEEISNLSNEAIKDWTSYTKLKCKTEGSQCGDDENNIQDILRYRDDDFESDEDPITSPLNDKVSSIHVHVYDLVHRFAMLKAVMADKLLAYIRDPQVRSISHLQLRGPINHKFIALKQRYHRRPNRMSVEQLKKEIDYNLKDFMEIRVLPHNLDDNVILVSPKLYAELENQKRTPILERSLMPMTKRLKFKLHPDQ